MKQVRDNQPDETSTGQQVRDYLRHMRSLKYIYHYVQVASRSYILKVSNVTLRKSSAEHGCNVFLLT